MAFKYAIALTGGIATGKSTVVSLLALHGVRSIDADKIAHELLQLYAKDISLIFGREYLDNGKVNRTRLGELVFSNTEARVKLENFLHPKIREEIERQSIEQDRFKFHYIVEIPLFFETEAYPIGKSVVIYTDEKRQIERLMKRNDLSYEESKQRVRLQMSIEKKRDLATWVIDNSGNLKALQESVEQFVEMLKEQR